MRVALHIPRNSPRLLLLAVLLASSAAMAQTLPTGATITPTAAPGSVFQKLEVALPDFPNYNPDGAETTAVSPDGKTLLILTSGYNLLELPNGDYSAADSGEFVFVYDISKPSTPVEKQVVSLLDYDGTFDGIVWAPNGSAFYVSGGYEDDVYTFTLQGGLWAQSGTPINLGHYCDLMCEETEVGPTAAMLGITSDGNTLFVANHETDSITSVDLVSGTVLQEYDLRPGIINPAQTGVPGGEFPYGIAVAGSTARGTVYVSSVRDREIDVLSLSDGVLTLTKRIPVPGNPERMVLNAAQLNSSSWRPTPTSSSSLTLRPMTSSDRSTPARHSEFLPSQISPRAPIPTALRCLPTRVRPTSLTGAPTLLL